MTLLATDFLATQPETFQALRQLHADSGLRQGVVGTGDFLVVQHAGSANMSVDVAAGSAWILGTQIARQGIYHQINDATANVAIAAAHPTLPRVDQVFVVINDSSAAGGASDIPAFYVSTGTATAGAQISNPAGANYRSGAVTDATLSVTYPNRVRIADVLVPAAAGSIVNANIVDRRTAARRWSQQVQPSADAASLGNPSPYYQATGLSWTFELGANQVVECDGALYMEVYPSGQGATGELVVARWEITAIDGTTTGIPHASNTRQAFAGSVAPVARFAGITAGQVTVGLKCGYVNSGGNLGKLIAAYTAGKIAVQNL